MHADGEEEAAACMKIACLRVDERCERHVVEQIGKDLPHVGCRICAGTSRSRRSA